MSMSVSSVPTANAVSGASGVSTKGGATDAGVFFATLSQCMNTGSTGQETMASLMPLVAFAEAGSLTDEALGSLDELIQSLLAALQNNESQLESDPALLELLQQWIGQAQALLTPLQADVTPEQEASIDLLAKQPQTVAFVVRDQLEQIQHLLRQANTGTTGNAALNEQAGKLLQQLGQVLNRPAVQTDAGLSQAAVPAQAQAEVGHTAAVAKGTNVNSQAGQGQSFASLMGGQESTGATDDGLDLNNQVMTAGQFAMKAEGLNATKQVPVIRAQHFAQEMSGFMVKQMLITSRNGVSEAKITLYPENLGQVNVRLTMQNGQLVAQFMTEHAAAKDMLDQQMSMLRGALQSQGIQVEKLEVSQQTAAASEASMSFSMFQGDRQPNANQEQRSSRRSAGGADDKENNGEPINGVDSETARAVQSLTGSSFTASV
ncbi:flagellar hook-length control protein FliK [Paenibacillus sp. UMB4589-SE434]|uniref:flagellar hook-length control protein FliK n=1 Tax=Paenibacillus sp. UMB4589-SE434 TaxID=3046314 RepID=UPI00254BA130|nr:flagellar hook-length control protein FliK [Paenibacillus sp. UMB4589-SE434]MDK8180728.1 flagellar hook-length control protein FliK [Paenibacillus sp. UMB4589-SE434]